MDLQKILDIMAKFTEEAPTNYLSRVTMSDEELQHIPGNFAMTAEAMNKHITDEYIGLRFFDAPIAAMCRADDPGFEVIKRPEVVGEHFLLPTEWLPEAKTVISIYLPNTMEVIESNNKDKVQPSWEWLFGRVDGQNHMLATGELVKNALIEEGYKAVVPVSDPRYIMRVAERIPAPIPVWSSNWSERHIAYVAGLGTFGRHTNFISKLGCCGRIISVVTDWEAEPTPKDYDGIFDYCADCGACYAACPAQALSENGKEKSKCSLFLRENCAQYSPRYGCGKCQTSMPCATKSMQKK